MPTANERKALWFLAIVALSGSGVRLWRAGEQPNGDVAGLARQIERVDSARADRKRRSERPKPTKPPAPTPDRPIDIDRASAAEIEALPGIGPALAARIVSVRDSLRGFGSVEALCVVRGIGPALAERLRPLVTFTSAYRPLSGACGARSTERNNSPAPRP